MTAINYSRYFLLVYMFSFSFQTRAVLMLLGVVVLGPGCPRPSPPAPEGWDKDLTHNSNTLHTNRFGTTLSIISTSNISSGSPAAHTVLVHILRLRT